MLANPIENTYLYVLGYLLVAYLGATARSAPNPYVATFEKKYFYLFVYKYMKYSSYKL